MAEEELYRAGCQSCDKSGRPSFAASSAYHKRPTPSRCFQPSDASAWHIGGLICEDLHEFDLGRDITRELERDCKVAKAALVTASTLLQAEVERYSSDNGSARSGLAPWQMLRVRAFIDGNLHRTIHIRDLSAVAQRSPAHFCRKFKVAAGGSPHAYLVRKRLERACNLMVISAALRKSIDKSAPHSRLSRPATQ
jgi:AraC-like DNA-binding protein